MHHKMENSDSGRYDIDIEHGEGSSNSECDTTAINYSYNRISDDLMENILSYLTFSEKVMYESVSKQWQRVIFNQQMKLELRTIEGEEGMNSLTKLLKPTVVCDYATGYANAINFQSIKRPSLISVLKKCKNISEIDLDCYCDGEDLEIIGKYCLNLKIINTYPFGFNEKNLYDFGLKYGNRLRKVILLNSQFSGKLFKNLFIHCYNLAEIDTRDSKVYIDENEDFLPKLQSIHGLVIYNENLSDMEIISKKYSQTLEKLYAEFYQMTGMIPKTGLSLVSRLKNLKDLNLYYDGFECALHNIDESLVEISENCSQLKKIQLSLTNNELISINFFDSFKKFKNLVKLELNLYNIDTELNGNVECLKLCKNLKHFTISYNGLKEDFFINIDLFLPNLTNLNIQTSEEYSDQTIIYFSGLKYLRTFIYQRFETSNKSITDTSICQLINNCSDIEMISFHSRPKITEITIETLISKALLKPKIILNFYCGFSSAGDEVEFSQIDLNSYENRIPENLIIQIVNGND